MTKLPFLQILEFISHFLCTAQPEVFAESFIWGGMEEEEEEGGLFHSSQAASMCESISSHCMALDVRPGGARYIRSLARLQLSLPCSIL